MIAAGHETTGVALFWSLYLVAAAPAVQERLAAEVATLDFGPGNMARQRYHRLSARCSRAPRVSADPGRASGPGHPRKTAASDLERRISARDRFAPDLSSLFGAGRRFFVPSPGDQVRGARGRGQGTETVAQLGGLPPTLPLPRCARARARFVDGNQRPWPADKVERWAIDRLIPYAKNARTHTDAQVAASIKEWGWTSPALVGEDGGLIAGHARCSLPGSSASLRSR